VPGIDISGNLISKARETERNEGRWIAQDVRSTLRRQVGAGLPAAGPAASCRRSPGQRFDQASGMLPSYFDLKNSRGGP